MEGFKEHLSEANKMEVLGTRTNIMGTLSAEMKMAGMRKPQSFTFYPLKTGETVVKIQSSTRIGQLDLKTGKGHMSKPRSGGAYGIHLNMPGGKDFELSTSELAKIKKGMGNTSKTGGKLVQSDNSGISMFESKFREFLEETDKKTWMKFLGEINKIKTKVNRESDEGFLIDIYADIISAISRKAPIQKYLDEIKKEFDK